MFLYESWQFVSVKVAMSVDQARRATASTRRRRGGAMGFRCVDADQVWWGT
jgi:hypothetical protein